LPDDPQEVAFGHHQNIFPATECGAGPLYEFSGVKPTGYKRGQRKKYANQTEKHETMSWVENPRALIQLPATRKTG
jgi:hypothetical protein